MNTEEMSQNLRIFWDLVTMNQAETPTLPADIQAALDQSVAQIHEAMTQAHLDTTEARLAFLAGGLSALDWVAAALEQTRTVYQPEVFAGSIAPTLANLWVRAWAVVGSEALGVPTR